MDHIEEALSSFGTVDATPAQTENEELVIDVTRDRFMKRLSTPARMLKDAQTVSSKPKKKTLANPYLATPGPSGSKIRNFRDSRFLFRLSPSLEEQVQHLEKSSKPKQLEHFDAEIEQLSKEFGEKIATTLDRNIKNVRTFFLKEIAPKTLAAQAATDQVLEIIKRTVGTEVESTTFTQFENMMKLATRQKMAEFIVSYLGTNQPVDTLLQPIAPSKVPVPSLVEMQQVLEKHVLPGEGPAGHIPAQRKPRHVRAKEAAARDRELRDRTNQERQKEKRTLRSK